MPRSHDKTQTHKPVLGSIAIAISLLLSCFAFSSSASAFEMPHQEVRIGLLAHNKGPIASETEDGPDINIAYHQRFAKVDWGSTIVGFFGHGGAVVNLADGTSYIYAGINSMNAFGDSNWYFELGGGFAVHDGDLEKKSEDRREMGSRVLFRFETSIGYQFENEMSLSFFFDHISNGSILNDDDNKGLDTWGLRWGWVF